MFQLLTRAKQYRERAEECLRFSELVSTTKVKAEYEWMARQYNTLARVEEHLHKAYGRVPKSS